MRQVNFNLNGLIQNIRVNVGKKNEETVEAVVEKAVEQAVAGNLLREDVKIDTVEFHIKKDEAIVDSVSVIQPAQTEVVFSVDDNENIFAGQDDADAAKLKGKNAVFGTILAKKATAHATNVSTNEPEAIDKSSSGSKTNPFATDNTFEDLVAGWEDFLSTLENLTPEEAFERKLAQMELIISAAEREAEAYASGNNLDLTNYWPYIEDGDSEELKHYKTLKAQANTWRCYRVTLTCNYNQQMFHNYLEQLQNGATLADLGLDYNRSWEFGTDYAYMGSGQVWNDFVNFEEIGHFGGYVDSNGIFVANPNEEQRYLYDTAMIAVYKAKMAAINILLYSSEIPEVTSDGVHIKDILRRTLAALRFQLSNLGNDRHNIAMNKGYEYTEDGLIPGLTPTVNAPATYTPANDDPYFVLCEPVKIAIKNGTSIDELRNSINNIIAHAQEQLSSATELPERKYWQAEINFWQQILNSGNTSQSGNGSSAIRP